MDEQGNEGKRIEAELIQTQAQLHTNGLVIALIERWDRTGQW
jgi:hypothetical protein